MGCPDRGCPYEVIGYIERRVDKGRTVTLPIVGISSGDGEPLLAWVPEERGTRELFSLFNGWKARLGETGLDEVPVPLGPEVKLDLVRR